MEGFRQQLTDWQWFYATVATSAATLTGLLFVSLSVKVDPAASLSGPRLRRAQRSFGDFLYVLMMGLVFLVPHQSALGLAVALFVLGAARGVGLVRQASRRSASRDPLRGPPDILREYGLPSVASVGLMLTAVEVSRGDTLVFYALVIVVAALLTTGSWNAWLLLVAPVS
jgi:hypothetical protein